MRFFSFFDKIQPYMRLSDWVLATVSLLYGLYAGSALWIGASALGFALAWYDPGTRLRRHFAFIKPASRGSRAR